LIKKKKKKEKKKGAIISLKRRKDEISTHEPHFTLQKPPKWYLINTVNN